LPPTRSSRRTATLEQRQNVEMRSRPAVRLEPATLDWLAALRDGDAAFTARFGIAVEPGWAPEPETLTFAIESAERGRPEWGVHLFFDASDGALVGNGGWTGPPDDGRAELGYAIAQRRRNRGLATAAVRELVDRASAAGLREAVARTAADNAPSAAVLTKCGFTMVGEELDPHDGVMSKWLRTL
jgi:ribosomal-protein-alanine N-acetyltransferase